MCSSAVRSIFRALSTTFRRWLRSSGLERKSNAPSLSACTAVSTLPCAVITATGTSGACFCIHATSSRPSPSGNCMSVRHRSNFMLSSRALAPLTSAADSVSISMRPSVNDNNSQISGSSSMTRASGWRIINPVCPIDRDRKKRFERYCLHRACQDTVASRDSIRTVPGICTDRALCRRNVR